MFDQNEANFRMLRIRMVEEEIAKRYKEQKMRCPVHLSIGQEACAVGVAMALQKEDKMVSTHRGHAHYLAKGGSLKGLIGELYGKASGCSRGNGGSMHLVDLSCGFYGSTSIVGGTIPVGVGLAFADRLKGSEARTVICIGDAAVEEGVFHEAANFASLHNLNVTFACENNLYSCYTHILDRQPDRNFEALCKAHKLEYRLTKPNYVEDIYDMAWWGKRGPNFIEMRTYRFIQHCGPDNDDDLGYRPKEEIEHWKEMDPVKHLTNFDRERIELEIKDAFDHAENALFPDQSEVGKYVYKTQII